MSIPPNLKKWVKRLLAPAIALVAALWAQLQQQPLLAAILGILAALGLLLGWFGFEVWKRFNIDLTLITAGWIKSTFLGFAPNFRKRYKRQIIYDNRIFNVRGLQTIGAVTLELEQVFVDLKIGSVSVNQANKDLITTKELEEVRSIWEFLHLKKERKSPTPLVIIGAPGCGKTTLLQKIALVMATNKQRHYKLSKKYLFYSF